MRGKKSDQEFLSEFISNCVNDNKITIEDILAEAKLQIENIDNKIKEVDKLKILRSKLLDVVNAFDKKEKSNIFIFDIKYPHISQYICNFLKDSTINIESLYCDRYLKQDIIFTIKQLIEYKIISKLDNCLLRGKFFHKMIGE